MGIYLYGIAEAGNSSGSIGVAGGKVYTIRYKEVEAVVSQIPEGYKVSPEDALRYEAVLRGTMEKGTVIPMSFGTIAENPAEIEKILKRGRSAFKKALDKMRGKIQVNVIASWSEESALKRVLSEDGELSALRAKIGDADQALRIELGRKAKKALDEKRRKINAEIMALLRSLSADFEENRVKDANTILNESFLLEKSCEQDFHAKVEELERKYAEINLVAVGPLPPYNFVRIEVRKVDFKTLKEAQETLGLGGTSNISEIRQAFNDLAENCHPDPHPDDLASAEKFEKIRKAYDALTEYCEHRLFSFRKSEIEGTIIVRERTG